MADTQLSERDQKALNLVKTEESQWSEAEAFVTEKVAFQMRNLLRQLRKNYWGVFDKPNDPVTGRKKIWVPFTESQVEAVVKNIDLDTKDITFRAKNPGAIGKVPIVRSAVRNALLKDRFGEKLDQFERNLAIDGTAVWKTVSVRKKGKVEPDIRVVDLLNLYIDPTADSIQDAYRVTERALMTPDDIKAMSWDNTDGVLGTGTGLAKTDPILRSGDSTSNTKFRDVWELWGQIPKWLVTGEDADMESEEEIEGQIVVSGIEAGDPRVHLVEENKAGVRPYEEAWYSKVAGRWYGRGVAEKLMMLQLWMNIVVNIRINRSYTAQLGLFKVRRGAGITSQMLSRLTANGIIPVNNMDDVEQLVMQEASQASYNDENVIRDWGERVTAAFEVVTGERLPAETTATAVAVQGQAAQSQFVLVKEGIGQFLDRWMRRHYLPIVTKAIRPGEVVRLMGDVEELRTWDEALTDHALGREVKKMMSRGRPVTVEAIEQARQGVLEKFRKMGNDRYVELTKTLDFGEFDIEINVTNEKLDTSVVAQNLVTMLQAAPQFSESLLRQLMDIMGLDVNTIKPNQQALEPGLPSGEATAPNNTRRGRPLVNAQEVLTAANTRPR